MNQHYYAWMLRIWQPDEQEGQSWRVSLEDPHTRELIAFESVDAINEFINNLIEKPSIPKERGQ